MDDWDFDPGMEEEASLGSVAEADAAFFRMLEAGEDEEA